MKRLKPYKVKIQTQISGNLTNVLYNKYKLIIYTVKLQYFISDF